MVDYYIQATGSIGGLTEQTLEYDLKLIQNLDDGGQIPTYSIALDKPENAQNLAFEGKTRETPIEWVIYDDGTDKSRGTYAASDIDDPRITSTNEAGDTIVKTVYEQVVYVNRYIQTAAFGASWKLFGGRFDTPDQGDDPDSPPGTSVVLEELTTRETAENPLRAEGSMKLAWGEVI